MTAQNKLIPQLKVTEVFLKNWKGKEKITINRGGTRSSKTFSVCQMIIVWLFTGYIRENEKIDSGVCSIVRKYKATLKSTVLRDFEELLHTYGLYDFVKVNKTDRTYTVGGRTVHFFGADDEQKIRGHSSDILFCNEANELGYKTEFFQLLVRTRGPVFIDFNPSDPYIWIKEELEDKRAAAKGDVQTIISTYKDNGFLQAHQIEEIEYLQVTDPSLWQVYGLGQYGKVEGLVIPEVTVITELPIDLRKKGSGLDFGFSNDETSLYDCGYIPARNKKERGRLYIDQRIYELGLTDSDLIRRMDDIAFSKRQPIVADSAASGSIAEIRRGGYNIKPVKKIRDSIRFGIGIMKSLDIYVTARSTGFLKEQKKYKHKQHINGDFLPEPIDAFNHAMDAVRYYCMDNLAAISGGFKFANPKK